jgi:HK97 family phage portal protein
MSVVKFDRAGVHYAPPEQRSGVLSMIPQSQVNKATWPNRSIDTYTGEYAKLALIFRCVGIMSTSAGAAPIRVYSEDIEGNRTILPRHPMRQLIVRPNPQMRESRFTAFITMLATIAGFVLIEKERSYGGNVIGLWPLRSDWARPIPRTNAPPDWEYRVPGREAVTLPAADLIHVTYADRPDGSPFGVGALEVALREIGLLNVMTDFLKAFFDTGAMPQIGLVPADNVTLRQSDTDLVRETWVRRHGGLMRSVEPAILAGIKDVKRLSFDFNELAFTDLRDISDLAICTAFGVPPGLVGVRMGLERNTFSNAAEMRRSFYEDTIAPWWARFDDALTLDLLPEFQGSENLALEFDTSDIPALQEDRNARATWVVQATLGGALSVHTMHAELGLPKPEGDDFYLRGLSTDAIPSNDPLGAQAAADEAKQQAKTPPKVPLDPTAADAANATALLHDTRGVIGPRERRAAIGTINRRLIKRVAEKSEPWLRTYFREAGDRILRQATRAAASGVELRAATVIDWGNEEKELGKQLTRLTGLAGDAAYDAVSDQLGASLSPFDLTNPHVMTVRTHLAHRIVSITDESKSQVQDVVTNALTSGRSPDELTADLRALFSSWTEGRARTVARTESMSSFGLASAAGYRESGVVDRIECLDNPDHTDDYGAEDGLSCAERDGLIDDLDSAELHIRSEHPNGQLAIAPVLIGED